MSEASVAAGETTREQLLNVAERLFLERGPQQVSLRQIVREAGQKNQSALQYHFGGREGLLAAIARRRMDQLEARRRTLVDEAFEQGVELDLRAACAVLIRAPFLLCREDRSFRNFLGVFGQQLLASEKQLTFAVEHQDLPSLLRLRTVVLEQLPALDLELLMLRFENVFSIVLLAISRRARNSGSFRGRRADLFFNNLVDQVAAMLSAPVSSATMELLDSRS